MTNATNAHWDPEGRPGFRAVGFLLSTMGFEVARRFGETLAPLGLEPREFAVLNAVTAAEGSSQQALAEQLGIPASRMVAVLDQLEERGMVERRANRDDRRAHALHLTAAGRRVVGKGREAAAAFERELCSELAPEEREQLQALLGRVASQLGVLGGVHSALRSEEEPHAKEWPAR